MANSDDDEVFMSRAFHVPEFPSDFDPTKEPTTGEEFLLRTVYESRKEPKVVTVDVNSIKTEKPSTSTNYIVIETKICKSLPDFLMPTEKWEEQQLDDFSDLVKHVTKLKYIHKYKINEQIHLEVLKKTFLKKQPTMTYITTFSQNHLIELFDYINTDILESFILDFQSKKLPKNLHLWVYSMLSQLEIPYLPDLYSVIRTLAIHYSVIRYKMFESGLLKSNGDDLKSFNLIICLIVNYFKQFDLVIDFDKIDHLEK